MIALLIIYIYTKGYRVTFGDAWAQDVNPVIDYLYKKQAEGEDVDYLLIILHNARHARHKSFHYKRLAIDLNLFKDGVWMTKTSDHEPFGKFWELLGGSWGGRFGDGNHYSWGE